MEKPPACCAAWFDVLLPVVLELLHHRLESGLHLVDQCGIGPLQLQPDAVVRPHPQEGVRERLRFLGTLLDHQDLQDGAQLSGIGREEMSPVRDPRPNRRRRLPLDTRSARIEGVAARAARQVLGHRCQPAIAPPTNPRYVDESTHVIRLRNMAAILDDDENMILEFPCSGP